MLHQSHNAISACLPPGRLNDRLTAPRLFSRSCSPRFIGASSLGPPTCVSPQVVTPANEYSHSIPELACGCGVIPPWLSHARLCHHRTSDIQPAVITTLKAARPCVHHATRFPPRPSSVTDVIPTTVMHYFPPTDALPRHERFLPKSVDNDARHLNQYPHPIKVLCMFCTVSLLKLSTGCFRRRRWCPS